MSKELKKELPKHVTKAQLDAANKAENKSCGLGCGIFLIGLIIMGLLFADKDTSNGFNLSALIVWIGIMVYVTFRDKKSYLVIAAVKEKKHQKAVAKQKAKHEAFLNSLPDSTRSYLVLEHQDTNTYKYDDDISINNADLLPSNRILLLKFSDKSVAFFRNKDYQLLEPHYYLATISFRPNVSVKDYTTTNSTVDGGHAQSRLGSALIGGALLGPVGAAIGASRKRKIKGQQVHTSTQVHHKEVEHTTNAYLQFVTTDFKHIKQIKLTNIKTKNYDDIDHHYMLSDLELRILEKKHGLLK